MTPFIYKKHWVTSWGGSDNNNGVSALNTDRNKGIIAVFASFFNFNATSSGLRLKDVNEWKTLFKERDAIMYYSFLTYGSKNKF